MAKIYMDLSGRRGLAHKHQGDVADSAGRPQLRYLGEDGQFAQGIWNPIRNYGYASPAGNSFTTVTETDGSDFTNAIRCTVYDPVASFGWYGENGSLMWRTNTSSFTSFRGPVTISIPVAGTAVKFTDMIIYQLNGVRTMFFSYQETGSGGSIGRIKYDDTAGALNWLQGVASGGFYLGATNDHHMFTADNGYMYVLDGAAVHKIDGTTAGGAGGTATANVLTFPAFCTLTEGVDWRGYAWIGVQSTASQGAGASNTLAASAEMIGVYVWDRQSTVVRTTDFIPLRGAREIRKVYISPSGKLRVMVITSERFLQIREYANGEFIIVEEFGINAYPLYRDSVGQMGGLTVWLGNDGLFYAHGFIAPGEREDSYIIGDTSSLLTGNYDAGAILVADSNGSTSTSRAGIFWSGKVASSNPTNRMWFPHASSLTAHAGNPYTLVKYLPKLSKVNFINIFCIPTASATSTTAATVGVYFNQSTTSFKDHAVTLAKASRGYVNIPINKPYVNSVQLKIAWNASTTTGTDDFCPSFAEIDYDPEPDNL